MPGTNASTGYNATFGIGDGADPEVFTAVAEVISITPPSMQRDVEEATHLKSPDQHKEFIPNLSETGDATFTINYVPSATDVLITAFNAGTGNFRITFPSGVTLTFAGIVTSFAPGEVANSKMTASVTIKPTGKATYAAAV